MKFISRVVGSLLCLSVCVYAAVTPKYSSYFVEEQFDRVSSEQFVAMAPQQYDAQNRVNLINAGESGSNVFVGRQSSKLALSTQVGSEIVHEEYSIRELGMATEGRDVSIVKSFLTKDDANLTVLTRERDDEVYAYYNYAYFFTVSADLSLELRTVVELDVSYYDSSDLFLSPSNTKLLVLDYSQNASIYNIDVENDRLELINSGELTQNYNVRDIFFSADEEHLVALSRTYGTTNACIASYALSDAGGLSALDAGYCSGGYFYYDQAFMDYQQGQVLLKDYRDFLVFNVDNSGAISLLVNDTTTNVFAESVGNLLRFEDGLITFTSNQQLVSYQYDASANFTFSESFNYANEFASSSYGNYIQHLNGDMFRLSPSYYSRETVFFQLTETGGLSSFVESVVTKDYFVNAYLERMVPLSDELFLLPTANRLNLIDATSAREFAVADFVLSDVFINSYNFSKHFQISDNRYLLFGDERYLVVDVNASEKTLSTVKEGYFSDNVGNRLRVSPNSNGSNYTMMHGKFLVIKANYLDELYIFELLDDGSLVFERNLTVGEGVLSDINQISYLTSKGEYFSALNTYMGEVATVRFTEDKSISSVAVQNAPGLLNGRVFTHNERIIIFRDNIFATYEVSSEGVLELLSTSISSNSSYYGSYENLTFLGDNYALSYGSQYAIVYIVEPETGALREVDEFEVRDIGMMDVNSYYGRFIFNNESLWYVNSSDQFISRIELNRAPFYQQDKELNIVFSEGNAGTLDLNDWIFDADSDVMTFASSDIGGNFALDESGTLSYDGEAFTGDYFAIDATDARDGSTAFRFDFIFNSAPRLIEGSSIAVNQYELTSLDLLTMFEDSEFDKVSIVSVDTAGFDLISGSVLVGSFDSATTQSLNLTVVDDRAATRSISIPVNVNGAPFLSGDDELSVNANQSLDINLNELFTDSEQDTISYQVSGLPSGLRLSNQAITGKPGEKGTYTFVITASDSRGATSQVSFKLLVSGNSSGGGAMFILLPLLLLLRRAK